jgi:hypothetical protein
MPDPRTKETALATLVALREDVAQSMSDPTAKAALTEALVREILNEAWRQQFDDEDTAFQAAVRDLVNEVLDSALEEPGQ